MADLRWEDVRGLFDPEPNGTLPDVHVPDTSVADWQAVLDLVRARGWRYAYTEEGAVCRLPTAERMVARRDEADPQLRVWPDPGVLAIFRPHSAEQIDFDVDLRELQGQQRLDVLCGFLRAIGRRLGKPVLMTPEGGSPHADLGFDVTADRVVLLTDPDPDT
ncbi:hypothetical protein HNR23_000300 [Nocardiopsis mwathae]|uniref:Uncharacterized protein n=1 Tax=Nocardiopsis mwathae TaxID=1472723 RepID=A0A7X0D3N6_9ACTN|nr:hypothetical protein [Nocardiopsis mwathae]MBB6170240.1 hypothetical protein [Nocardiopsis mwathae]